jgi:hypothetical protein
MSKPGEFQVVVSVAQKLSTRNAEYYVEFELLDLHSGQIRKTYVSANNYNWETKNWGSLYEQSKYWLANDKCPCICADWTESKPGIINADTQWHLDDIFDLPETIHSVAEKYFQ